MSTIVQLVEELNSVWLLLGGIILAAGGIARFEITQKNSSIKMKSLEEKLDVELKKVSKNERDIAEIKNDIDWIKKSFERVENKLDVFMITYSPPSAKT